MRLPALYLPLRSFTSCSGRTNSREAATCATPPQKRQHSLGPLPLLPPLPFHLSFCLAASVPFILILTSQQALQVYEDILANGSLAASETTALSIQACPPAFPLLSPTHSHALALPQVAKLYHEQEEYRRAIRHYTRALQLLMDDEQPAASQLPVVLEVCCCCLCTYIYIDTCILLLAFSGARALLCCGNAVPGSA